MKGVEIFQGVDGENVKLIGDIDRFGVEELVGAEMDCVLKGRGGDVVRSPGISNQAEFSRWVTTNNLNGIVTRTGFDFSDPSFYRKHPEIALIIAACRDPHINGPAAATHGVEILRADSNTENVANHVIGTMKYGLGFMQLPSSAAMRDGHFLKKELQNEMFQLPGKVLGIVGFGKVGTKLAKKAIMEGMDVVVYNDSSPGHERGHDARLKQEMAALSLLASQHGCEVRFAATMEELAGSVDIMSLHASSTNALGEKNDRSNPVITFEHLRALKNTVKGRAGLGIFINYGRDEHVEGTPAERFALIKEGALKYIVTDVSPKEAESPRGWKFPIDRNDPDAFRFIVHPHLGGSGDWVSAETVDYIRDRLIPAFDEGYFDPDFSRVYPRHSLDRVKRQPGQIVVHSQLSTVNIGAINGVPDAVREFEDIFREMRLRVADRQWVAKFLDGTRQDHLAVPVAWTLDPNGSAIDYASHVRNLVDGALSGVHGLRSLRIVPTSSEQKTFLQGEGTRLTSKWAAI